MKYILSLIIFISIANANTMPVDFFINKQAGFDVNTKSIDDVSNSLESFFKAGDDVLNGMSFTENKANSNWKFTGFATTLGVSSSGKLGLVAFKGTAFAEIYWRKKAPVQSLIEETPDLNGDIVITDLSKDGIDEQVENAFAIVKASGKVTNLDEAKKGIREKIEEFAGMASGLYADPTKKYYFAGLRYDLVVGASGNVGTVYTIGGSVFLRMIWRPIKKVGQTFAIVPNEKKTELQKIIDDTALSLESLDENLIAEKKGLKLQSIRFGYGRSIAGKINLVNARSSLIFSVIFGKNQKYKPPGNKFVSQSFATSDIKGEDDVAINWDKFQRGLNKALKLSTPFLRRAERKDNKWEVSMLRMAFTVSGSRGVGLTTVGDLGQVQLIYTK